MNRVDAFEGMQPEHRAFFQKIMNAAVEILASGKPVQPIVFLKHPGGVAPLAAVYHSESEKADFALAVRLMAQALRAEQAIFVSEAWTLKLEPDEAKRYMASDIAIPPSRDPRRQECLVLMVETRAGAWTVQHEIVRPEGAPPYIKPNPLIVKSEPGQQVGRFQNLLGPVPQ